MAYSVSALRQCLRPPRLIAHYVSVLESGRIEVLDCLTFVARLLHSKGQRRHLGRITRLPLHAHHKYLVPNGDDRQVEVVRCIGTGPGEKHTVVRANVA